MQKLENTIRKNSWAFGAFLAVVSPFLALFVLHYLFMFVTSLANLRPFQIDRFYLLSLSANLLLMRYYLVSIKMDKTGKSILIVTFLMVFLFFMFKV
jgi:hypothetical protein